MTGFLVSALVGIVCIAIGISNRRGNISMLHSYHTHRVSEEDRIPFGKQVGLGTILIGVAIVLYSILSAVAVCTGAAVWATVGTAVMVAGLVIGLAITFHAMFKYNKGIF